MNKLHILLPVHNRKLITEQFIHYLKNQTFTNYHLILIDDGSTDGTSEMVSSLLKDLTIIRGEGNLWWAGSLQKAYKWLRSNNIPKDDIILIINDDTSFEKDYLEKGISSLKKHNNSFVQSVAYPISAPTKKVAGIHVDWKKFSFNATEKNEDVNCLSTRGLFFYYSDFLKTGGFKPAFLSHYTSDYEFTIRAHKKGISLISDDTVKLFFDDATTGIRSVNYSLKFGKFIKELFSKRSAFNPVMFSMFIFLASPWKWKLKNLIQVWGDTFVIFKKYFVYRIPVKLFNKKGKTK